MAELVNGEIRGQRRLLSLLAHHANAHVGRLDHADVIPPVPNGRHWLPGVRPQQLHDAGLVGGGAPTTHHGRTLAGKLNKLQLVVGETDLCGEEGGGGEGGRRERS